MNLIEHFSTYENVPVRLADVASHVKETSRLDVLSRYSVDVNPEILRGIYREYNHKPPYSSAGGKRVGEVLYSTHLEPFESRMVQCKEMLHAFDDDSQMASKIEQVAQLAEDIILAPEVLFKLKVPSEQWLSDRGCEFVAMAVLLPMGFLDEIRPIYKADRITVGQISQLTRVPSQYVRLALRDDWAKLIEPFT